MKYILVFLILVGSLFASIGEITAINGKAYAIRGGKSIALFKGSKLEKQDTIKTMANTRLQIVFIDHTVISLGQKTNFRVDKYDFNRQNQEARFSVSRGIFKSITGKIGHLNHSKYTLKTNNATIGVRGTIYIGRVEPNKESIACTSGEIVVYTKSGSVVVKKGEITSYTPFTAPSKPKRYDETNLKLFSGVVSKRDVDVIKEKVVKRAKTTIFKAKAEIKAKQKKYYTEVTKKVKKVKEKVSSIGKNYRQNSSKSYHYKDMTNKVEKKVEDTFKTVTKEQINKTHQTKHDINLPSREELAKVAEDIKEGMQDMYGDWSDKDMSKKADSDERDTIQEVKDDKKSDYDELIQRAGSSNLHYVGKVSGENILNNTNNEISLDFDLGKASVDGRVKFDKEQQTIAGVYISNFDTDVAGSVNPNGNFDFQATTLGYSGGGNGELKGEHLDRADGSLNINKGPINSGDVTFRATKQ